MRFALLLLALCDGCSDGHEQPVTSTVTLDLSETVQRSSPSQVWLSGSVIDPRASACAYLDYDFAQLPDQMRVEVRGIVDPMPCVIQGLGGGAAFRQLLDVGSLEPRTPLHARVNDTVDGYDIGIDAASVNVQPLGSPEATAFPDTSWRRTVGLRWWFARVNLNTSTPIDPALLAQFDALLVGAGCVPMPLVPGHYKWLNIVADESGAIYQPLPDQPGDQIHTYVIGSAASDTLVQSVNAFRTMHDADLWIYFGDEAGLVSTD
jgi:hypothetical protein